MASEERKRLTRENDRKGRLLDAWAKQYQQPLLRYFGRRVTPPEEAHDLVQEVFLRLARQADLGDIKRVDSYIFRVAANVLTDRYRRQARKPSEVVSYDDSVHGQAGFTPERVLSGRQDLDRLIEALAEMPERTRQIFVLYHLENIRQKDIADRLGIALSTLEKHMARANRFLLKRLDRDS